MLEKAKSNLSNWSSKIDYLVCDNRDTDKVTEEYDILIEGWSFGHLIVEEKATKDYWIKRLIDESMRLAKEKIIFIETLGTNIDFPAAPGENLNYFYTKLKEHGFNENIIQTNYLFDSHAEAGRIMGGFFGEKMKAEIENNKLREISEYTGVWIFDKEKT